MNNFEFIDNVSLASDAPKAWIVRVPQKIESKRELFAAYEKSLEFPEYFGHNWDALFDCLCDLHWITNRDIRILHEGLPLRTAEADLAAYISVLHDACKSWQGDGVHNLTVFFLNKFEHAVTSLIERHVAR